MKTAAESIAVGALVGFLSTFSIFSFGTGADIISNYTFQYLFHGHDESAGLFAVSFVKISSYVVTIMVAFLGAAIGGYCGWLIWSKYFHR
jgi:hypothetical protein